MTTTTTLSSHRFIKAPTKAQLHALYSSEIAYLTSVSRFAYSVRPATLAACVAHGWLFYQPYARKGEGLWKLTHLGVAVLNRFMPAVLDAPKESFHGL